MTSRPIIFCEYPPTPLFQSFLRPSPSRNSIRTSPAPRVFSRQREPCAFSRTHAPCHPPQHVHNSEVRAGARGASDRMRILGGAGRAGRRYDNTAELLSTRESHTERGAAGRAGSRANNRAGVSSTTGPLADRKLDSAEASRARRKRSRAGRVCE